MDTLKVLVVGSGDMGGKHLRAYAAQEQVHVVAVADPDESRAQALVREFPAIKAYADYETAIDAEQPDIVSVCVPAFLHEKATLYALDRGCHVLCEKPIALTLDAAERMVSAASRSGRLGIIFQRRYMPVWKEVMDRLPSLGSPLVYHAADFRPIRPKRLMHSRTGNGGPVIDCCVHDFDMTHCLFGDIASVYAAGATFGEQHQELRDIQELAVDTATITLRFHAGHAAHISYCWGLPTGTQDYARNEIIGPMGMLQVYEDKLVHHMFGGRIETIAGLDVNGHQHQIAAFVHAVRNRIPLPVAPEEALYALRISHAALNAQSSHQPCCFSEAS